jgi:hypothetical protein
MKRTALIVFGVSLFACSGGAKREAAILVAAVDTFRRAETASKDTEAKRVAAVACTDASVCEAKRTCVAAIEPTARALLLKKQVERSVAGIEGKRIAPDSPEVRELPAKLEEAERLLSDGRQMMSACDRKLAELELRFGI